MGRNAADRSGTLAPAARSFSRRDCHDPGRPGGVFQSAPACTARSIPYFRRDPATAASRAVQLTKLKWPRANNLSVSQLVCGSHKLEGYGDGSGVDTFDVPD